MSFQEMCTPDTGSSHTLINHDVAARHGLAYDPNHNAILKNASGTNMEITGITKITLQIGKHKSSRTAIIVRNLNHKILIGWKSCIELALIPTNFPQQMRTDGKPILVPDNCTNKECNETYSMSTASRNSLTPKEIAVALTKEFRSVLSDELSTKPMKARPMHIHIKTVYKPYRTTVARTIPKRYEAPAKTAIKELIKRGVIIPVTEPTEWCSPAFFVSKPDGKRVRLVTDFTRLNQFVERAVHPFPSPPIPVKRGNRQSNTPHSKILRQTRRSARILPAGAGRRELIQNNLPTPIREIQVSTSPNGTQRIIR